MVSRLISDRLAATKKSVLLLGARQVGKSTLIRSLGAELFINLADESLYLSYAKDPDRLRREVSALRVPGRVVIDEVQRVPSLLNTVQALLDEGTRHRFVLTGSSARKLKRGQANLLPGRVLFEVLDPLSIWELGDAFDLERALRVGTLPGIYLDRESGDEVLDSYATIYLREEIQAEALLRDVGSYARFLDVAAASSGQWINYSKLASDAEIAKETLRRYFQILEDTLLAFRIPPFQVKRSTRRVSQRDRVLFFDIGVRNALLGIHRGTLASIEKGHLFEHWLMLQCLYFIRARRLPWQVSSYRTENGVEVDFVIDTRSSLLAVECKLGRNVRGPDLSGLRSFAEIAHRPLRSTVVYQGEHAQRLDDDIEAIPYREFLLRVLPALAARS